MQALFTRLSDTVESLHTRFSHAFTLSLQTG